MLKRSPATILVLIPFGMASTVALAEACGDYPLTPAQAAYLQTEVPDIDIPEGSVPFVQRCDVDSDGVIDNNDLIVIRAHRGQPAAHPDDPMDWDRDGVIHGRDVGGCASSCTSGCSANGKSKGKEKKNGSQQGAAEMEQPELPGESGACYQVEDFDGDGAQDFLGIYEYTGSQVRGNDWALQVVILTEDGGGNVQHNTFPYSGQLSDGSGDLQQHLSLQPAGPVDLNPGSITLDQPGVVSYRNGEPTMIFYFDNGVLAQAFYGIDD